MLSSLPKSPDPTAPSPEALLEYKNSLDLLRKLLPAKSDKEEDILKAFRENDKELEDIA